MITHDQESFRLLDQRGDFLLSVIVTEYSEETSFF